MSGDAFDDQVTLARAARMAELGVLTASLVHELRQPLFAVKGTLQLAMHRGEPLDIEDLRELVEQIRHAEELLDHYGAFGRVDESPQRFDLNDAVRRALAMMGPQRRSGITMEERLCSTPLWTMGRPVALQQVAVNLLQNAHDAVSSESNRRVSIETGVDDGHCYLAVSDSGPGFAAEVRARLFEPFVTTKPLGKGTGLGLFIARRLVAEAGGSLDLEDLGGSGSRLVARLPAHPVHAPG